MFWFVASCCLERAELVQESVTVSALLGGLYPISSHAMDQVLDKIYQTSCASKTVHASEVAILIWPCVWCGPRPVISKERI